MLMRSPLARERRRPAGFIKPCQPTLSHKAPGGPQWIHEIKPALYGAGVGEPVLVSSRLIPVMVTALDPLVSAQSQRDVGSMSRDDFR